MKNIQEEYYNKFGKEIFLEDVSKMETIIKEAEQWWDKHCKDKQPRPRLKFKYK